MNEMAMPYSFADRVRTNDDVLIQEIDGEIVFLNTQTETYSGLDAVGSEMFRRLTSAESIEAAYRTLRAEYDVDGDQLREDLNELLNKLFENGLIKIDHERLA